MVRAVAVESHDAWPGHISDSVELDSAGRRRRRLMMKCQNGLEFLLDLPVAPRLHHGDRLVLDDSRRIEVIAAPEPLMEIMANGIDLVVLAYHFGNRHLEAQVLHDRILIRPDHVIENMVAGLGGTVTHVHRPFQPESGAYDGSHHHD
jgi:urease accessory protein